MYNYGTYRDDYIYIPYFSQKQSSFYAKYTCAVTLSYYTYPLTYYAYFIVPLPYRTTHATIHFDRPNLRHRGNAHTFRESDLDTHLCETFRFVR